MIIPPAAAVTPTPPMPITIAELRVAALTEELATARVEADSTRAELAELRQADAERRGQGRWARLRAAWRGGD
jgi:hypothetical protein